jgi:hypothetical protein
VDIEVDEICMISELNAATPIRRFDLVLIVCSSHKMVYFFYQISTVNDNDYPVPIPALLPPNEISHPKFIVNWDHL